MLVLGQKCHWLNNCLAKEGAESRGSQSLRKIAIVETASRGGNLKTQDMERWKVETKGYREQAGAVRTGGHQQPVSGSWRQGLKENVDWLYVDWSNVVTSIQRIAKGVRLCLSLKDTTALLTGVDKAQEVWKTRVLVMRFWKHVHFNVQ